MSCIQSNNQNLKTKAKDILILGNGFDLAFKNKTCYSDFIRYVACFSLYCKYQVRFYNISDRKISKFSSFIDKFIDDNINLNKLSMSLFKQINVNIDIITNRPTSVAKKICDYTKNCFFYDFLQLIFNDKYSSIFDEKKFSIKFHEDLKTVLGNDNGDRQKDTEEQIQKDLKIAFDIIEKKISFAEKSIYGWMDVEAFIEYCVTGDKSLRDRFSSILCNKQTTISSNIKNNIPLIKHPSLAGSYYDGIQAFCTVFSDYLDCFVQNLNYIQKDKNTLLKYFNEEVLREYLYSLKSRSKNLIEKISIKEDGNYDISCIIDFNYTSTSSFVFNNISKKEKSGVASYIYHVNGSIEYDNIIFGYSNNPNNNLKVDKSCYCFEKKNQRILKNTDFKDLNKLISEPNNIIIFGHSCSTQDRDIIKKLLSAENKNLNNVIVLCYDDESLISIFNNLIEILGQDRMDELLDYSSLIEEPRKNSSRDLSDISDNKNMSNLFFAVREKS